MECWLDAKSVDYQDIVKQAPLCPIPIGSPGTRTKRRIKNLVCAFDIETSKLPDEEQTVLYLWQMQLGLDTPTIIGRNWADLRYALSELCKALSDHETLVLYVHNLYYEFQFLRTIYEFKSSEVFAVQPRKVLKCTMYKKKIEFRCSYLLTNLSLAAWTKKMGVRHQKLSGEAFGYDDIRYPWTNLTDNQLLYGIHDVLGLVEALTAQMQRDGDTLSTIPMTSTGYVRRDVKRVMRMYSRAALQKMQPNEYTYYLLRDAFRGGDTHANRFYAGCILDDVGSVDRSSSYPDVLVNCRFPMGAWTVLQPGRLHNVINRGFAVVFRVRWSGLRLKTIMVGDPPLSYSKTSEAVNVLLDNGRVLSAESVTTTITDVDYMIYKEAYVWDSETVDAGCFTHYGDLPEMLKQLIIKYYRDKTELKGDESQQLLYDKSKALLNAIYGMMAQDPVKQDVIFDPGADDPWSLGPEDVEKRLASLRQKCYNSYAWGVWCTAWARYRLWEGVKLAGDGFIYCDTDSVKYLGQIDLTEYNNQRIADSTKTGAFAIDRKGKKHYMGVFEDEGRYDRFITDGAKKYAFEKNGVLGLTVAGVNKAKGGPELEKAGGLDAFRPGFVFRDAGGTEAIYNDNTHEIRRIDGHEIEIGPNIYIKDSTYTLGITAEYEDVLTDPYLWDRIAHQRYIRNKNLPQSGE